MAKIKVGFNKIFKPVNQSKHRYRVLKGSAGSGKSVNVAQDYILKLSDPKYKGANLLVVRKVGATNRHSTYAELLGAIKRIFGDEWQRFWYAVDSRLELRSLITGNEIVFRGMKDEKEREKVKSINLSQGKIVWIWCEEATEFTQADIDILDDRLRGDLSFNPNLFYQMTLTFNPVSAQHWIKKVFFDVSDKEILTHHSTYLDNRFIDDAYHKRMMRRKETDPEGYKVYGLGEWGETSGLILTNYEVEEFDTSPDRFDFMTYGQDFGFNHANAILSLGFKDDELYICDEIYVHEKDTSEIIEIADRKGFDKSIIMYCDSAEPDRIKMWKDKGYNAVGVQKGKGSVNAQIDILKKLKIHIHPRCVNVLKEIQQWKWKKDEKLNKYLDQPVEFMDDAMAALRYGIEPYRNPINIPRIRSL
mgnify:CR=1 FL=1